MVTSLMRDDWRVRALYEDLYCARGKMENWIKDCRLDVYADRTSAAAMAANQLSNLEQSENKPKDECFVHSLA